MAHSPAYDRTRIKQSLQVDKWAGTGDPNLVVEAFVATATIVSTAAGTAVVFTVVNGAGTAVPLDATYVGPGRTVRILSIRGQVSNTTAWATTMTVLDIKDGNDVSVIQWPIAALTSKAVLGLTTANAVLGAAILTGFGRVTAAFGLKVIADANAGSGSSITFVIHGHIEPT